MSGLFYCQKNVSFCFTMIISKQFLTTFNLLIVSGSGKCEFANLKKEIRQCDCNIVCSHSHLKSEKFEVKFLPPLICLFISNIPFSDT